MKSVLAIIGLAVAFIIVSVLIAKPRDMAPYPQEKPTPTEDTSSAGGAPGSAGAAKPAGDQFNPPREGVITADLTFKGRGAVTIEFYPKAAPHAVKQITDLIKKGFYDGIIVHRVEKPVVVQFGNPVTKTMGVGAPETDHSVPMLKFEDNNLPHVRGAIGLARLPDKDTASSQLFIDLQRMQQWDGDYCVIGKVVNGMDVVDKVEKGDAIQSFKIK